MNNLETVQSQLFDVKKIQLHSGLEGYDSPEMFGVYKSNGGKSLGVVGKVFEPMDLNLFMDSIVHSVEQCDINLDLNNLTFKEYKDGSKVSFELSLGKHEIETPMIGDIMETFMRFNTGFDGLTKTSVSYRTMRLWCLNVATSPMETQLSFKNTLKNHLKSAMLFCDEIWSTLKLIETNNSNLKEMVNIKYTAKMMDEFLTKVIGYNAKDYKDLTTRKRNILDKINQSVAIESQNTGNNLFSLVQGISRYTTHGMANGDEESLLFSTANKLSVDAHKLAVSYLN